MTEHIISSHIKWLVDYEVDGERLRFRCFDSLRDTPIEFTLRRDELASLAEFLQRFIVENREDFAYIDVRPVS